MGAPRITAAGDLSGRSVSLLSEDGMICFLLCCSPYVSCSGFCLCRDESIACSNP